MVKKPPGPDLFDFASARGERDRALSQVSENNEEWMIRALRILPRLKDRYHNGATGEEIRLALVELVGPPKHHNAWGALIRTAVIHQILADTGEVSQMRTPRSHARRTPVYVWR